MTDAQRIQKLEVAAKLIQKAADLVAETVPGSRWEENGPESHYRDHLLALVQPDKDGECLPNHIELLKRRLVKPLVKLF